MNNLNTFFAVPFFSLVTSTYASEPTCLPIRIEDIFHSEGSVLCSNQKVFIEAENKYGVGEKDRYGGYFSYSRGHIEISEFRKFHKLAIKRAVEEARQKSEAEIRRNNRQLLAILLNLGQKKDRTASIYLDAFRKFYEEVRKPSEKKSKTRI